MSNTGAGEEQRLDNGRTAAAGVVVVGGGRDVTAGYCWTETARKVSQSWVEKRGELASIGSVAMVRRGDGGRGAGTYVGQVDGWVGRDKVEKVCWRMVTEVGDRCYKTIL
ncbi:hypothetical protein Pcinc_023344 [Petrolisthes cinctipes]|uniref:Uncharacterized protein n=1 Tax=Petrolisthes cinctipes TaxID=88211 RepID=A0AAE1FCR3_PETCI|nr:hypothetical protein Pcinc_023344 [Petrolisthes cinctipes]